MSAPPIRTLLVDDEVLARLALRQALAAHADVDIVGECGNAAEAQQAIQALEPDLLFLDIRMPGIDGFKLLHRLKPQALPMVVFATAYGQHALRAFDASAIDYLMKPIDQARFDQAMARVRRHWHGLHAPAAATHAHAAHLQRISVRVGEHIRVVAVDEIDWIRADGNYVQIHANGTRYLHRETLSHLLAALDPARFLRIHRGVIVNVERIREVHPLFKGGAEVVLHDGTRLDLSRRFRAGARVALGLP
ncbi:LytTR family transcriptional regulator DNA-binding domain-containing protein [Fulvimonas sp. R45]|uniref:LytR/AlgR family response regulator transcription factor n=1 Tax=Fulvimonas sp. R45 TaxID=3045937 RepID=UPI00265D7E87|nr:LytTR family transcriptional regulator DNA-binding domain-containing protein [Fulvimonas sp. R45]MDO1529665.1 LytTR family transcriptional regulator DNA-binding domain-containing protein [Fulvimonas sp. R45]